MNFSRSRKVAPKPGGAWELAAPPEGSFEEPGRRRSLLSSDAPLSSDWDRSPVASPVKVAMPKIDGLPAELARERRRKGLDVHYGAEFDLAAEIFDVCGQLATDVSRLLTGLVLGRGTAIDSNVMPAWRAVRGEIEGVAAAVHELWASVVRLLADGGAVSAELRAEAARVQALGLPVIGDHEIREGTWVPVLVERVAPLAADLSVLLGRNPSPAVGYASDVSDQVTKTLRGLDRAAQQLEEKIPRACKAQEHMAAWMAELEAKESTARDRELAKLGLP